MRGSISLDRQRPFPIRNFNGFNRNWYRRRFSVGPGITYLWQVKGRSFISHNKRK
ncbi:MAG: hypothetical protein ACYSWP_22690 [Planctomycetota bacterium]